MQNKLKWTQKWSRACESDTYGAELKLMIAQMFNQVMCVQGAKL